MFKCPFSLRVGYLVLLYTFLGCDCVQHIWPARLHFLTYRVSQMGGMVGQVGIYYHVFLRASPSVLNKPKTQRCAIWKQQTFNTKTEKLAQSPIGTRRTGGVKSARDVEFPQQMVGGSNLRESRFSRIFWTFHFSISRHFHFTFHSRSRSWDIFISLFTLDLDIKAFSFHFSFSKWVNQIFISLFTSRNEWTRFSFHFSLLELPIPTLAGHCNPPPRG